MPQRWAGERAYKNLQQQHSINYLELLAAFLGLQMFMLSKKDIAILLRRDSYCLS